MATTTNYAWETPDDTDLVKDGASAIRTLGSSIDTTTKALNPSTTLGDIEYRSSTANTNTRLPLGTAGQVLTVNSGATAPEWATSSSGGMTLISTTTLTGASVTLSSIPSTYKNLQLVIRNNQPETDGDNFQMRFNGDTANRYNSPSFSATNSTVFSFGSSSIQLANNLDNGSSSNLTIIDFNDYANTTTWKMAHIVSMNADAGTPTSSRIYRTIGQYNQTAAISSITIYGELGNFTSGTALLYGVQ